MKKLAFCAAAAVLLAAGAPLRGSDCAQLVVVQVLAVARGADGVVAVWAPGGLSGRGADFDAALSDLAAHAPGTLFLGAAEHVILAPGGAGALAQLARSDALRPAVRLYVTAEEPEELLEDAQTLAECLRAHPGTVRLTRVRAAALEGGAVRIPALVREGGGYAAV